VNAAAPIPVTVLTGYLGAGKTTLLNRILSEDHGRRYAVIVNEFGEIGIDNELILNTDEELFEMNNGCICCTVRGDLIRTLHGLLARLAADAGAGLGAPFDAIVIETSGLADPGPVAQTFFVDHVLQARTRLDSITTVVDARHVLLRLADSREAVEQIAFADQIVLNKTDLGSEAELQAIEARLRRINLLASIHRARRADVALDQVLGRGGFALDRIVALEPGFLAPAHGEAGHVHDAHCGHDHGPHDHVHDGGIRSVSLSSRAAMDRDKVSRWLEDLVAANGRDILRAKGIIDVKDEPLRLVFQSVHMLLEGELQRAWRDGEARSSRLVFIGRHLDAQALARGFEACAA
jgi:G3E family GTPase